ncbi:MAG: hypothetical protein AB7P02_25220 [Alphaproteobacteria bacterium]
MSDTAADVTVIPEGLPAIACRLDALLEADDGLAAEADAIRAAIGRGETWDGGGGAAPFFTITPVLVPGR